MSTDNLRITRTHPLISPAVLEEELPLSESAADLVGRSRQTIKDILWGDDPRLLVVVGPCSVHDPAAAMEYAGRLAQLAGDVAERIFCVMRVYFEKPRTVVGWKGLINDPGLDGSYQINHGLRLARRLLLDVADVGLPAGTEFLDTTCGQYYTDLVSWGAIGARTVESQIHRELASGLSMPVGVKNRTDGNVQVAIDALRAAAHKHLFPSLTKEGAPAILETGGNPDCHLVLRGGDVPNYGAEAVAQARTLLQQAGLPEVLMVDCSHANSRKDAERQPEVARTVCAQRAAGDGALRALMLESHLVGGRQELSPTLRYGQSITDACLSFDATRMLLLELCERLSDPVGELQPG
ncbi:MAG: 3-deoxy-7-phosphoheptulonate synthase [Pseudomonadales bacterium]